MPWIPAVIAAGSAMAQGVMAGESAKKQEQAAHDTLKGQRQEMRRQQTRLHHAGEQAREAISGATDSALGSLAEGTNQAASAYEQGAELAQDAASGARADITGGADRGRGDIQGGYAGAESALGGLTDLQQYGDQAAQSIDSYDVTGQRSRLGELYDQGFDFEADPGYQFRQQQGEESINRAASARGGRNSGRTYKELAQFNQGLASNEYNRAYQRRMQGAGMADQSQNMLALNQAGRTDAAALAAQHNQMGLAGVGYGAQGQIAGMRATQGSQLAGLGMGAAGQLAGIQGQLGQQQLGMQSQLGGLYYGSGQQAAGMQLGQGQQLANLGMGVAGAQNAANKMYSQQLGGTVQYAGGELAAYAGAMGQASENSMALMGDVAEAGGNAAQAGAADGGAGWVRRNGIVLTHPRQQFFGQKVVKGRVTA